MYWLGVAAIVSALSCPSVDVQAALEGRLLITFAKRRVPTAPFACVLDQGELKPSPEAMYGEFQQIDWGVDSSELLISACDPNRSGRARCHLERVSLDGRRIRTYPDLPVTDFQEADGRLTPGGMTGPARVSPTGEVFAARANGRSPALIQTGDGKYITGLTTDYSSYAWSPDGKQLAYTRAPGMERGPLQESQLFIYDIESGNDEQLTRFSPEDYRPWWNPFATPSIRYPLVSGVSWARNANVILFYVTTGRGVFEWRPDGTEIARIFDLVGRCWRLTQLSADGRRILYLSSTRRDLCLLNGGDQVRLVDADGSNDHVVLQASGENELITDIDWWTE